MIDQVKSYCKQTIRFHTVSIPYFRRKGERHSGTAGMLKAAHDSADAIDSVKESIAV